MPEFIEVAIDKFRFKIATDRLYEEGGVWARFEAGKVRVGLSDFLQQRSGDVAFVEVESAGTHVEAGDEVATIETVKVNVSLPSPVSGRVMETNQVVLEAPERINGDPYGAGWLALIEPSAWSFDEARLLTPGAYLEVVKRLAGGG